MYPTKSTTPDRFPASEKALVPVRRAQIDHSKLVDGTAKRVCAITLVAILYGSLEKKC